MNCRSRSWALFMLLTMVACWPENHEPLPQAKRSVGTFPLEGRRIEVIAVLSGEKSRENYAIGGCCCRSNNGRMELWVRIQGQETEKAAFIGYFWSHDYFEMRKMMNDLKIDRCFAKNRTAFRILGVREPAHAGGGPEYGQYAPNWHVIEIDQDSVFVGSMTQPPDAYSCESVLNEKREDFHERVTSVR